MLFYYWGLIREKILWHLFIPCSQPCIQNTVIDLQKPLGRLPARSPPHRTTQVSLQLIPNVHLHRYLLVNCDLKTLWRPRWKYFLNPPVLGVEGILQPGNSHRTPNQNHPLWSPSQLGDHEWFINFSSAQELKEGRAKLVCIIQDRILNKPPCSANCYNRSRLSPHLYTDSSFVYLPPHFLPVLTEMGLIVPKKALLVGNNNKEEISSNCKKKKKRKEKRKGGREGGRTIKLQGKTGSSLR